MLPTEMIERLFSIKASPFHGPLTLMDEAGMRSSVHPNNSFRDPVRTQLWPADPSNCHNRRLSLPSRTPCYVPGHVTCKRRRSRSGSLSETPSFISVDAKDLVLRKFALFVVSLSLPCSIDGVLRTIMILILIKIMIMMKM